MKILKLSEIAEFLNAKTNGEADITSVVIDTRKVEKGSLFICIKGERFDAHDFAKDAEKAGVSAVVAEKAVDVDCPVIVVKNTKDALLKLSGFYRSKFDIPVVALTGSVGKTTTKDFTHLVLSAKYNCIKTQGNLNNEIGMPQTLFSMEEDTQAAVIEMGMNHFGEISNMVKEVKPTVAMITNIGVSHIENLGSREGILKAKLEILEGLPKNSPLILNGDNDLLKTVKNDDYNIVLVGIENENCQFRAVDICENDLQTSFKINYNGRCVNVTIPTIGIHNVYNALFAFAAGYYTGVDENSSVNALANYTPSGMRQKIVDFNEITVIEDCYNASPDSMNATIETLSSLKAKKRIAVFADMLELGDSSESLHYGVGKSVAKSNIDFLVCYGEKAKFIQKGATENGMKNVFHFDDKEELCEKLVQLCEKGDAVTFKGSRGMKLEDVIESFYKRWK